MSAHEILQLAVLAPVGSRIIRVEAEVPIELHGEVFYDHRLVPVLSVKRERAVEAIQAERP